MNKNDIINEVVSSLVFSLSKEQFIFKRFTVDMLAKGLKQSSIKNYMDHIRPFFDMTGKNYRHLL